MKNIIFLLFFFLVSCAISHAQTTIIDIAGTTTPIDSLAGKRVLVSLLPTPADTAVSGQLLRFMSRHAEFKVIGLVPSSDSSSKLYPELISAGVIVTTGIRTVDSTGNELTSVLKWLTDQSNGRNSDSSIIGSSYFLSRQGRPYGQLGSSSSLDTGMADNVANTNVPGEEQ